MSPSALLGVLIDVEEMVLLVARPAVLAAIHNAAPFLTTAATPAPSPRCLCERAEHMEAANSVSLDTSILSMLL